MNKSITELQKDITERNGLIFSTDTLKIDDLLTSVYSFLKAREINQYLQDTIAEIFTEEPTNENYCYCRTELKPETEDEASYILNKTVWNFFNEIAPDGYYFGNTEGDGSCFGWFLLEEE